MKIFKSINKRIDRLKNVSFDKQIGFYKYKCFNNDIIIRHPKHYVKESYTKWLCENLYYHYYLPQENDVVLDLGTGYGEEAVYLYNNTKNIKFYGVEIQPIIYECLSNTLHRLSKNFTCSSQAITNEKSLSLFSNLSYAAVGEQPTEGYIDIPTVTWDEYIQKNNITEIDLFKMNIEGAEKEILNSISDFKIIKRFIISCHDFRANHGDGEFFRTKEFVLKKLKDNNYKIKTFENADDEWHRDWIYAEQQN